MGRSLLRAAGVCLGMVSLWGGPVRAGSEALAKSVLDEPTEARESVPPGSITMGGHISEHLTDGFLDVHIPMWRPGNHSLFFNPRVMGTDDSLERYSLGGGWRWLLPEPEVILGANAYWDHLESPNNFEYEQLGVGCEVLTRWVDARFNYYLPEGDVNIIGTSSDYDSDISNFRQEGQFLAWDVTERWHSTTRWEAALEGFYAEAGFLVPYLDRYAELRFFGGYYNYETPDDGFWRREYEGYKVRAELRLPPAVTLDVAYVDDEEIMGGHWIGGIRVTVPFEVGNIFRGKNPFEGIGDMFRPRRREFAERMSEMVMRSPRVAVVQEEEKNEFERTLTMYQYAPESTTGGGTLILTEAGGGALFGAGGFVLQGTERLSFTTLPLTNLFVRTGLSNQVFGGSFTGLMVTNTFLQTTNGGTLLLLGGAGNVFSGSGGTTSNLTIYIAESRDRLVLTNLTTFNGGSLIISGGTGNVFFASGGGTNNSILLSSGSLVLTNTLGNPGSLLQWSATTNGTFSLDRGLLVLSGGTVSNLGLVTPP